MGHTFLPYTPPVLEKCCRIIHSLLLQYQQFLQNPELDEPDKSCLVVALDLLSGLTRSLGMALEPLMVQSMPNPLILLTNCLKDPQAAVRQSAYGLLANLAIGCFAVLRPYLQRIMAELILQLETELNADTFNASRNAAWSAGEVALRYGRGLCNVSSVFEILPDCNAR